MTSAVLYYRSESECSSLNTHAHYPLAVKLRGDTQGVLIQHFTRILGKLQEAIKATQGIPYTKHTNLFPPIILIHEFV